MVGDCIAQKHYCSIGSSSDAASREPSVVQQRRLPCRVQQRRIVVVNHVSKLN